MLSAYLFCPMTMKTSSVLTLGCWLHSYPLPPCNAKSSAAIKARAGVLLSSAWDGHPLHQTVTPEPNAPPCQNSEGMSFLNSLNGIGSYTVHPAIASKDDICFAKLNASMSSGSRMAKTLTRSSVEGTKVPVSIFDSFDWLIPVSSAKRMPVMGFPLRSVRNASPNAARSRSYSS
jgi:hypothetical protein